MPVSPAKWVSYESGRVEQVFGVAYGTKRKNEELPDPYNLGDLFDRSQQVKRICSWPDAPVTEPLHQNPIGNDDNNMAENDVEMTDTDNGNFIQTPANIINEEPHIQGAPALSKPLLSQHTEMIMNINDDDETMAGMTEYDTACDAMSGEGAVDPSQYGRVPTQHEAHCFGPEKSPNSGNVRCYCRPTWDTLRSSNSFFSDIY